MCGIAGIYAYRESAPPVDEQELLRIREAMPGDESAPRELDIFHES